MKKKLVFILLSLSVLLNVTFITIKLFSSSDIDDGFNDLSQVKHEDMLSMMLEQTAGEGDYSLETRSSWPTKEDGYIFNSSLSKCEKGSKLRWDDVNNVVVMVGTTSDKCYAYFDKYNSITINSSSATVSDNSIVVSIDATAGDGSISKYYYSKDNGLSYVDSTSNTYTFTGLTTGDYTIKYYVEDSNGKTSEVITKQLSVTSVTLAAWVKSQYTGTQGGNNLYYHDGTILGDDGTVLDAGDNSYRYAGAHDEVNNFVCFGSDEETCPDDNLYRIIGVFDVIKNGTTESRVKLIKWDYATTSLIGTGVGTVSSESLSTKYYKGSNYAQSIGVYYWNSNNINKWSTSELNTTNLNTNFINNIGSTWANKIADTTWRVGGNTSVNIISETPSIAYTNEYTKPAASSTYTIQIGLMYISDYGFAASPSAWTSNLGSYNSSSITSVNWMYIGMRDWTIVRISGSDNGVFAVSYTGAVHSTAVQYNNSTANSIVYPVRPVFYFKPSVTYVSGDGTKGNPIRLG